MSVDLSAIRKLVAAESVVGVLVASETRTVGTPDNQREIVTIRVWDVNGHEHTDNIPTSQNSSKRRHWVKALMEVVDPDDPTTLTSVPRKWTWESGGGGQYTFTVLVPGQEQDVPQCTDVELQFLDILTSIAEGASEENPFRLSAAFGDELLADIPGAQGRSSVEVARALHVKGAIVAKPGETPDEILIVKVGL